MRISAIKKMVLSLSGCVLLLCTLVLLPACSNSDKTVSGSVSMPDVVGLPYDEAKTKLKDLGLSSIDTVKEDGSSAWVIVAENWVVLSQDPAPGTEVTSKTDIVLTLENAEDAALEDALRADEELQTTLSSLVGKPYTDADSVLKEQGYTITWLHATTRADFTESVNISIADPNPEIDPLWVVVGFTDNNPTNKTVTLLINTQENIDSQNAAKTVEETLTAKLSPSVAWGTAQLYGEAQYPYGFNLHNVMGVLAETAEDENTWFIKATCDVTSAYGQEARMTCEARITGTSDNPQVISFIVY